jgi:hypothetical protein
MVRTCLGSHLLKSLTSLVSNLEFHNFGRLQFKAYSCLSSLANTRILTTVEFEEQASLNNLRELISGWVSNLYIYYL